MNIAIDIGNTYTKAAVFENHTMIETLEKGNIAKAIAFTNAKKPVNVIVSSVGNEAHPMVQELNVPGKKIILNHQTQLPFKNTYATPATLGTDRLAGAAGAMALFPNKNCLIVHIGTCIVYDLITEHNIYIGGAISPGLEMKLKALNTFTARLPLVNLKESSPLIGTNTEESILSGVIHGTTSEIEGMIADFSKDFKELNIILTGGGANFFENKIKASIFAVPHLVLTGLNRILLYNEFIDK